MNKIGLAISAVLSLASASAFGETLATEPASLPALQQALQGKTLPSECQLELNELGEKTGVPLRLILSKGNQYIYGVFGGAGAASEGFAQGKLPAFVKLEQVSDATDWLRPQAKDTFEIYFDESGKITYLEMSRYKLLQKRWSWGNKKEWQMTETLLCR